ncbi:hypothetical protein SCLCIDRAFT_1217288 [Scleroderma citrinum Foug A]|uniref:Uncharacterized protein n=1 Tax=Scleroderma citrinum Foug A TaxID=1036808 RepID=A0A0C3A5M8_9AGAM|nr:hypothetical protein SCLCIDRAFT_1217288 [Scleroderma citrinum Foug A]
MERENPGRNGCTGAMNYPEKTVSLGIRREATKLATYWRHSNSVTWRRNVSSDIYIPPQSMSQLT